jgi:lipopolysaccharide biosynthesis glycosyltransferase
MVKKEEGYIPVVVAFTPNYFVPAATTLHSLIRNSTVDEKYHIICLLTQDISNERKLALKMLGAEKNNVIYTFVDLCGKLKDIQAKGRFTIAAYYRLLLPDLLPEHDKVIYMDCDMIVRTRLSYLYYTINLEGYYLAGVCEIPLDHQLPCIKNIGCDPKHYINSGFLVMNLELLRRDGMVARFLAAAMSGQYVFPDQDILNIYCKGKICEIPPYYNSIGVFLPESHENLFLTKYTTVDLVAVHQYGTIHYTSAKPWMTYTAKQKIWWECYKTLPKTIKREWKKDGKYWKAYLIYRLCSSFVGKIVVKMARKLK